MTDNNNKLKILLFQKKGGKTSARIIEQLLIRPYNPNQIAELLDISYNTAYYHMQILQKYHFIEKKNDEYGSFYEATEALLKESESFFKLKELI
ncbi:MAG: winged helix-turn-helix transcriptional regulator [Methanobrevibacter sp.]|uniref:ArsR/SmtB family transcription factor n=1 Tax=Methanobrevibacter sp. TaxID=66852 RepID=UPI0025F42C0A|nr:winged helix-turn-helix domain-containing protein [Methanobrevibacter sp.]MBR0271197.1 winged helix-turn-helix transcriptional regulator [Methanobrevibacter sp.]